MFKARPIDEMVRIAAAGGGMVIDAGAWPTPELVRIATAAAKSCARVQLHNVSAIRTTDDLAQIALAGGGTVVFCS
jgi:hypothetical protein